MIILDENVVNSQRKTLLRKRYHVRQIGYELGRKGMSDRDILPLLRTLHRPTLLTSDDDSYVRDLCDTRYSLIVLGIEEQAFAEYSIRVLRHPSFAKWRLRMGKTLSVTRGAIRFWQHKSHRETRLPWND